MSKIRIYELAKELGVDNKVILDKANEMGMPGKSSHSHSLDSDEADRIRRAILRQATATVATKREVLTTRVDKVTGTAEAVVESRSGNIIRRRKQVGPVSPAAPAPVAAATAEVAPAQEASPPEIVVVENAIKEEQAQAEVEAQVEEVPEVVVEAHAEVVEPFTPAVEAKEPEVVVVAEPVIPQEVQAPVQAQPAKVELKKVVANQSVLTFPEKKPTVGPKILGRISLPAAIVKKPPVKQDAKKFVGTPVAKIIEEDEDEKKRQAARKKNKKVEFSRNDLLDYDGVEVRRVKAKSSKHDKLEKSQQETTKTKASKRVVEMGESITVGELAKQMSLKVGEVIGKLMQLGMMATINQALDKDTAEIIATEFEFQIQSTTFDEKEILVEKIQDDDTNLKFRPPVITIMGHVDHGKTSLLDTIRKASVAAKEAGGITQHIGAYQVVLEDGRKVAFIDTPGHAAFTSMRSRGAQVTDIVVLVVAADDGVMPQTVEAINHAKSAGVPIVVALNKCDKPEANPDRVKKQLLEHGLQPEDWGGDTMYFPVSAKKATGIKELLEGLLLIAEVKEFKANPDRRAVGTIIETRQDRGRGVVATVLVQKGTLRIGDSFVGGVESGRVRSMTDHNGLKVEAAGPSTPVEITGFSGAPSAGDDFLVVENEAQAREVAQNRAQLRQDKIQAAASGPISLEDFAKRANNTAVLELNVIIKADVHGSVEAVSDSLEKLTTSKVKVRVVHAAVGGITESDVQLAIASRAIIVGFGVRAEPRTIQDAENAGVELRFYRIIYELLDDIKKAMAGLLPPIKSESTLGRAEVRQVFIAPKIGAIAGSYVTNGLVRRGALLRVLRDSRVIFEGKMASLRRFKDDAKEVQSGYECGIGVEGFNDVKVGDVIEVYEIKETAATLEE